MQDKHDFASQITRRYIDYSGMPDNSDNFDFVREIVEFTVKELEPGPAMRLTTRIPGVHFTDRDIRAIDED